MLKVLVISLALISVFSQSTNSTNQTNCLPNQYYDTSSDACVNEQGWCKPVGGNMYDSCSECMPCPANGTCPGNQPCYQNSYCNNLGSFCGGPYTNCTEEQIYSVSENKCIAKQFGYCQPTNGTWILGSCSQCQLCSEQGTECPGYENGLSLCQKSINCGDWSTTCSGDQPNPPTPTPTPNNNCLPNQYYDTTSKKCVNEKGWCKPSANSWMYDTCNSCVECPAEGACPGNQPCVQQTYCNNLGSYCGGPYVNCLPHQVYSVTSKSCINQASGFCKPTSGPWLISSCSSCQQCWGNGESCPGYQNDGSSYCIASMNCENWNSFCTATQSS